jgi:hypothetical protein
MNYSDITNSYLVTLLRVPVGFTEYSMNQTSFSIAIVDEFSGTTKAQRDEWRRAYRKYLDENPNTRAIVQRWQIAGCDPRKIALSIHLYVVNSSTLNAQRKAREKKAKEILLAAVRCLSDLETLYRVFEQLDAANRIANEIRFAEQTLLRSKLAFNTKRLGVSRPWTHLATIEGFVFEATRQRPTPGELVSLIRAGRAAAGQNADSWETNPVNIRKGLKNFKKNNPLQSSLWTTPSRRF